MASDLIITAWGALILAGAVDNWSRSAQPRMLNIPGAMLWYSGAATLTGKARAWHPFTLIALAIFLAIRALRGVREGLAEARGDLALW